MDLTGVRWRTSSYSGDNGGNCVQIAHASRNVAVRDSKDAGGAVLVFTPQTWKTFIGRAKHMTTDFP